VTQFTPKAQGTTLLSASTPAGFTTPSQFASINATVSLPRITLDSGLPVGNKLQAQGTIFLSVPAPPGLTVTLAVTSGSITLASTATGAGATQITVPVTAGNNTATYFVRGLASSGAATVSGNATGYVAGSGSYLLNPSGIVISGPGGPGSPFPDTVSLAGGPSPITVNTALLDANSNFLQTQPLAGGGASLSVTVNNQNSSAGTFPSPVTIAGGNDTATVNFAPSPSGVGQTTTLTVVTPSGFATPPAAFTKVVVNVVQ
jgi:hypothetical protein